MNNRGRRFFNFPFSLRKLAGTAVALLIISIPLRLALAHKGETHTAKKVEDHSAHAAKELEKVMSLINESYIANVKPVFMKSCFDCHSSNTNYPWYSRVPGAKQLIESDITEAKEHLDMSADFPFKGHGAPKEDLEAIRDSVNEKTMPPFRYRMMHWSSGLNDSERTTILRWVEESLAQFEAKPAPSH